MHVCVQTYTFTLLDSCSRTGLCFGTLCYKSMNQGKLDVVKQEMASVNINILRNQ